MQARSGSLTFSIPSADPGSSQVDAALRAMSPEERLTQLWRQRDGAIARSWALVERSALSDPRERIRLLITSRYPEWPDEEVASVLERICERESPDEWLARYKRSVDGVKDRLRTQNGRAGRPQPKPAPPDARDRDGAQIDVPAHIAVSYSLAQAILYAAASRRLLDSATRRAAIASRDDGIAFAGDAIVGLTALEQALAATRWVLTNSPDAKKRLPGGAAAVDLFWARVRTLRNALVHFDNQSMRDPHNFLAVDGSGIHVATGAEIGFGEWRQWLESLEPWLAAEEARGVQATGATARPPEATAMPAPSVADPREWPYPPPGVIWFGVGRSPDDQHRLLTRATEFASGAVVSLVGRFVRSTPNEIVLLITTPSGESLGLQSLNVSVTADVASTEVHGMVEPGEYTVEFRDETNRRIAVGSFRLTGGR